MLLISAAYITLFQRNLLNNLRGVLLARCCITTTGGRSIMGYPILIGSVMNPLYPSVVAGCRGTELSDLAFSVYFVDENRQAEASRL